MYVAWPKPAETVIQVHEQIVYKDREVIKTVYTKATEKSTTTVTEGGKTTVIATEKIAEVAKTAAKKAVDFTAETAYAKRSTSLPSYKLGALVNTDKEWRVIGAARLGTTPFSGVVEYEFQKNTFAAGLILEF